MANTNRGSFVQSVARALDLLSVLPQSREPMTVTELAKAAGLKLTTAHRLLQTMLAKGFADQDPETSRYFLGARARGLGQVVTVDLEICRIARPFLQELAQETKETVNLTVLDGEDVVYVDQIQSPRMVVVNMFARTGNRGPAYCTGSGKALLAYLPAEKLDEVLASTRLVKFTSETIDNVKQLKLELERIRRDGYSLDLGEREEGVRCVAAPVFAREGQATAAISVTGPAHRLTNFYLRHELVDKVKRTAAAISRELVRSA